MKIKSLAAGLVIASSMLLVAGPIQAKTCYKNQPGWHMVSKTCSIRPAINWQEYKQGVYTQPTATKSLLPSF